MFVDPNCDYAFQLDSQCYKVHKNERVSWFTAVNRCRSNNGSLAVFNDNITQYFPSNLLSEQAWIGLLKSRWTWPGFIVHICNERVGLEFEQNAILLIVTDMHFDW